MILLDCSTEFYGTLVTVLGILVAILIVTQFSQAIGLEKRIHKIKNEQIRAKGFSYISMALHFYYNMDSEESAKEAIDIAQECFIEIGDKDMVKTCHELKETMKEPVNSSKNPNP